MFKVGHAHGGMGKVRVDSEKGFQVCETFIIMSEDLSTLVLSEIYVREIGSHSETFSYFFIAPILSEINFWDSRST